MNASDTPANPSDSMSLAEHESTYVHPESAPAPEAEQPPVSQSEPVALAEEQPAADGDKPAGDPARGARDEHGRFLPREKHRAKSQHATAADVPRIAELTKKQREAERRAEAAEKRAQELEAQMKAARQPAKPEPPKDFDKPEPKYEDYANAPDQYSAWMRDVAAYDREKAAFEQAKTAHETQAKADVEARNAQRDAWFKDRWTEHGKRVEALFQKNPGAEKIIEDAGVELTPVMMAAVITDPNSAELMLKLAQNRELADDLFLATHGQAPSRELVALTQRRMNRGVQVAPTGSTAPAPAVPALPRPPNPVRTGAMKPADTPPSEDASLADHERFYGTGGGRRR